MIRAAEPTIEERIAATLPPEKRPVIHQRWSHLLFVHWEVEAEAVRRLLPHGLDLDTFERRAFVGVVPFTISGSRLHGLPPMPLVSRFHEVNLRTYVHRRGREPGVWFFSLDAASLLAVQAARLAYKLPYFWADMQMRVRPRSGVEEITYRSRRRGKGGAPGCSLRYWPTGAASRAAAGTLEHFLVERYLLYAGGNGCLYQARVHHEPYPIQAAAVEDLDESLTGAAGLRGKGDQLPPLYACEVSVDVFAPSEVPDDH